MTTSYELALLGEPTVAQIAEIETLVTKIISHFNLSLGNEVAWRVRPDDFVPRQRHMAAALFFGAPGARLPSGVAARKRGIPIVPVVSDLSRVNEELPSELRQLNALGFTAAGAKRVATALLECAGLLPRQRAVFVSYRRNEARAAALQLFDALSARQFDVFLDTHGVAPGDDFQATLWHRLCEADVLVMLDTCTYFASRWTAAEFGRALAKKIAILRVAWPDATPSPRTALAGHLPLDDNDLDPATGAVSEAMVVKICDRLEAMRSESIAVRRLNLVSRIADSIEAVGGTFEGIGVGNAVHLSLPDGRVVTAYPAIGVPTSQTLYEAMVVSPDKRSVVVYDHVGIHRDWLAHLDWLGTHIASPRWVRAAEAAWDLADWGDDR